MTTIKYIQGIGEGFEKKLKGMGISSVELLLSQGDSKVKRAKIASETGISENLVLKFVNHADLMRIKGIGAEYADLLEASGVDTVPELSKRRPDNLFAKMVEVNTEKKLVRKLPTERMIEGWVAQARELPRLVNY
jgi:predicted flap endonuclease-1-like 5' DNA nuclease